MHNIIPRHVVELLKNTSRYSENHREAGILFASIVNFHELYDESYEGGKECLRVLNELVGDFDELLSKPQVRTLSTAMGSAIDSLTMARFLFFFLCVCVWVLFFGAGESREKVYLSSIAF